MQIIGQNLAEELIDLFQKYYEERKMVTSVKLQEWEKKFFNENNVIIYQGRLQLDHTVEIIDCMQVKDVRKGKVLVKGFFTNRFEECLEVHLESTEKYTFDFFTAKKHSNAANLQKGQMIIIGGYVNAAVIGKRAKFWENEPYSIEFKLID